MKRYDWLLTEVGLVPRKKFHILQPRTLDDLAEVEARYGRLPTDYREFLEECGQANLFRYPYGDMWSYTLQVYVPPRISLVEAEDDGKQTDPVELRLGYYSNTGYARLEWKDGVFLHDGAVFVGFSGHRRKGAASFEEWLQRSFAGGKKLFRKKDLAELMKAAPPFNAGEQAIVEAMRLFSVRKVGVTSEGNIQVEVVNRSSLELPCLTVGVREPGRMTGAVALQTAGIKPGESNVIEDEMYKGSMNPQRVEFFRFPLPEPEDRPYFWELRDGADQRGLTGVTLSQPKH